MGFKLPTPIQADTIPHALSGRDVLACVSSALAMTYAGARGETARQMASTLRT